MDSGNSGSLQSSSGNEEECDSRAAVYDSGFITTTHHHHQPHPPPPPLINHHMFDQNQINNNNNNPLLFTLSPQQHHHLLNNNLDSVGSWSKSLPSNFSDVHQFFPSSSQPPFSPVTTSTTEPVTATNPPPPPPARNPKKRSRASRRAPTTVLTTDTTNFRAMVQEFTGVPAPPFTSSSSSPAFPRLTTSSFDLFGRPSLPMMMMRSNTTNFDNLPQLPPTYLLRPFPPKLQSSSSSLLDSTNLLTSMQNTVSFPCNSLNQSLYLNQKPIQNDAASNGFGVIGQRQNQINNHGLHTSLPDLVSTTGAAPTTARNGGDQMASGNWNGGGNEHHGGVVKGDRGFIEPWGCSNSD